MLSFVQQPVLSQQAVGCVRSVLDSSDSKWDCKYHVVFVPKRRRKAIFGQTRRQLGAIFHALARQKECQILEGHLMPDHVQSSPKLHRGHLPLLRSPAAAGRTLIALLGHEPNIVRNLKLPLLVVMLTTKWPRYCTSDPQSL